MSKAIGFDANKDIPDLGAKTIFITGGTAGLGRQAILNFAARRPKHIFFIGRNAKAADDLLAALGNKKSETEFTFINCELASLESVKEAAKQFYDKSETLDILICNAGIMAAPPALTSDGYEIQWGVNYLSHALLVKLLLPAINAAETQRGDARLVMVTSEGYKFAPGAGIVFKGLKTTQEDLGMGAKWFRYCQSKLAEILLAKQIASRYPSITAVSVHPGVVHTGLVENLPRWTRAWSKLTTMGKTLSLEEGALNTCWAATADKSKVTSGAIFGPVGVPLGETEHTKNAALSDELWNWTNENLAPFISNNVS